MLPEEYGGQAGPMSEINRKSDILYNIINKYYLNKKKQDVYVYINKKLFLDYSNIFLILIL